MENSLRHESAVKHVTGEARFVNDLEPGREVLYGLVVYSTQAHAIVKNIDIGEAGTLSGIFAILSHHDIPGENQMGPVIHDEPCLAANTVEFIGQAILLIAASDRETAVAASKLVRIDYEPLPAITSLQEAIDAQNNLCPPRKIETGNLSSGFAASANIIEGEVKTGAQEHWYLETQSALAVPGEGHEITVHASSQHPAETQAIVAEMLGIDRNCVEVEVLRMGGGFGGKETQANHVAAWAALLARHCKKPVRIHLFRDDDQVMTGKRHRSFSKYKIGFDKEGKILAYDVEINADAGYATDLSRAILDRALFHTDNAYFIPNMRAIGKLWKTNLPSNTAFRGFGGPQGMAVIENAIDSIARFLGKDPAEIRLRNFYNQAPANITHYGQEVKCNSLVNIYNQLTETASYTTRREEITDFNQKHEFTKRGMAITPVKFGISFTTSFLNQAGAYVLIYQDGTIAINHGGTEMGQGLHTKILAIAAQTFGLDPSYMRIAATNTAKVPNTSATAASSGSDLNGMAVKDAIDKLKGRIARAIATYWNAQHPEVSSLPGEILFAENALVDIKNPKRRISFRDAVKIAYLNQTSLSATGFYSTPGIFYDPEKGRGNPFFYYVFSMAVSEVEIDLLTGASRLLRTDILHDAGNSINPEIDKGQILGGFMQGLGWCTTEVVEWDKAGHLLQHSPDTYKIPTTNELPNDIRISFLEGNPNPGTIFSSKAIGEPPLMLSFSMWMALKDALCAANHTLTYNNFDLPVTYENIVQQL
jgi:xanthine dehydrogenase molybdopterin binding subunit